MDSVTGTRDGLIEMKQGNAETKGDGKKIRSSSNPELLPPKGLSPSLTRTVNNLRETKREGTPHQHLGDWSHTAKVLIIYTGGESTSPH